MTFERKVVSDIKNWTRPRPEKVRSPVGQMNLTTKSLARIYTKTNESMKRGKTHNLNPHIGRKSLLLFILWYK